ncbi:MAG: type II toxin-antitoxin system HicB family antitoxin [Candidatus Bipolaricaulia bacterium]
MPASSTSFAVQGIPIEALKNLQEVIALILEDMQAHDEPIPVGRGVTVSLEPKVTVTV